jgi:hypothetical protein
LKTDAEIKIDGTRALLHSLGEVEAERYISLKEETVRLHPLAEGFVERKNRGRDKPGGHGAEENRTLMTGDDDGRRNGLKVLGKLSSGWIKSEPSKLTTRYFCPLCLA